MKKFFLFFFLIMILLPVLVMAQDDAIDFGEILAGAQIVWVSGIGGLSVTALTELVKRLLKVSGGLSVAISIAVSIAASLFYLLSTSQFTVLNLVIYSAIVALVANGIFKFPKKT